MNNIDITTFGLATLLKQVADMLAPLDNNKIKCIEVTNDKKVRVTNTSYYRTVFGSQIPCSKNDSWDYSKTLCIVEYDFGKAEELLNDIDNGRTKIRPDISGAGKDTNG